MKSFVNRIREKLNRNKKLSCIQTLKQAGIVCEVVDDCTLSFVLSTDDPFDDVSKAFSEYKQILWETDKLYTVTTCDSNVLMKFNDTTSLNEALSDFA